MSKLQLTTYALEGVCKRNVELLKERAELLSKIEKLEYELKIEREE